MLPSEMQMPVTVCAMITRVMRVRMHVEAARNRHPPDNESECDQQAATDQLATLLEPHGNLPAEKQHEPPAEREQHRVADGKSQCEAERARVSRGAQWRRKRECRDCHEVIGAEAVKEAEGE